jgi:DNA-binding HxlR family transcriptional regulator
MPQTDFSATPCPIALGLNHVGAWWNILILRNAFQGMTRFDQFQKSLAIAPNILSRRLRGLVDSGLLERVRYSQRPPRDEYALTACGQDFRPVLWAMLAWGNKYFMPEGEVVMLIDGVTGLPADPVMINNNSGKPLDSRTVRAVRRHSEIRRQS